MKITKYGHCCLLIEVGEVRLLTDPGVWSTLPDTLPTIDAVLITHEHPDHLHTASLQAVLEQHPQAQVITNRGVQKVMAAEGMTCQLVEDGDATDISGVAIQGMGDTHAVIYPGIPPVVNTGYLVANSFYYAGDAFHLPNQPIRTLALPMIAPWMTLAAALHFAQRIKPAVAFPVHDGMLKEVDWLYRMPAHILPAAGIAWQPLKAGQSHEFPD